jgi:hypothetical protein
VGRTAAGRDLDPNAIELAVAASVRHVDTGYDDLLMSGVSRSEARAQVGPQVAAVLNRWRTPPDAVVVDQGPVIGEPRAE